MKEKFLTTFRIFLLINLCLCFTNCDKKDNEEVFQQFENEFNQAIKKNNAKFFDYSYHGLTPQESFFINSKLKFLKYIHGPENGSIESLVYFDDKTDSIHKIIRREIFYEWDNEKNLRTGNFSDTIYIIQFDRKKTFTYVNNHIVDSSFKESVYYSEKDFIKAMKTSTENKFINN